MTFSDQLRPLVAKVGGTTAAAEICGMTKQIVNAWLRGAVVPRKCTKVGVLLLLRRAKVEKHIGSSGVRQASEAYFL